MSAVASPVRKLGRFHLLRELGRGAQARVWLAHDPQLEREVALKLLNPEADAEALSQWLQEARAVSRLTHPNIVPVFEADDNEGQPYLVFEYVEGPTLAEARRSKPRLPAREAVTLLLGVLDALAAAHEQGIVHRDLKPSNILLGRDGRARVMDFGIAARTADRSSAEQGRIVGTAGYMSPEAARGEAPVPAMDVFAAGVMLGELLCGAPLMRESDPMRAVQRVQVEDMVLPANAKVDDTLRGIVQRALARDVRTRYDSARSMHAALQAWLNPQGGVDPESGQSNATLEFLLRRMRHKTDFPALSESVVRIQRLAASDTESMRSLSDEILRDVALTNKLLRMVNTAHFTAVAGGGISTISRAVALVGFAGIRNMALSVLLLEHMTDKAHAAQLKEEFLRAMMAGTMAGEISPVARESEEAFLTAMFQNLGRMLTEYYFPEEAVQIRQHVAREDTSLAREMAARRVLGIGLEDLGAGVAKAWGLPDNLQKALRVPQGEVPTHVATTQLDRLRWLGRGANAMTSAMLSGDGHAQTLALQAVAEQYGPVLGVHPRNVVSAAIESRGRMCTLAQAMGLHVAPGAPARRLLEDTMTMSSMDKTIVEHRPTAVHEGAALGEPAPVENAHQALANGLTALRSALASNPLRLNEVLNLVLDTMQRAMDFRCVVLCLREPRSGHLVGRVGLGPSGADVSAAFRVQLEGASHGDLFAALCAKGADLLVKDTTTVVNRLPIWYRKRVNAATFLVLPLLLKGAPFGLIYADKNQMGSIMLTEADLSVLRALREEAVAAFRRGA
ncbi:MAG: HDOD domain-containing protein [Rubrivivax sp.]|nr:HDOD domain-containing protein [Rubrivivax sp.]